ncbi:DNA/RNA non-specific endonuclease [Reinekea sp. G2M2-21]|uniref:DNA/RNA non-specific endonuclease n=1 Tax=Reinekea sp. G2M2-21 TaxID=2788942 RepID=UPI0018A9C1C2|nr:DNA/RNA non-specific endonuclease [Reinekea sp. G2M2-21]
MLTFILLLVFLAATNYVSASTRFEQTKDEDFTIIMNCENRGADLVIFVVKSDKGNAKRSNSFSFDKTISRDCQQMSTSGYSGNIDGAPYQRGHYLAFNTRDDTEELAKATNVVTNITPMTKSLNTGVYYETELITECYREISTLHVFTGPIWGVNISNDFFLASHGTPTPDYIWKLIYSANADAYIAWIFPNTHNVSDYPLDDYQVTFVELLDAIGKDKPSIASKIPWPKSLMNPENNLRNLLIDWSMQRDGRFHLTCQGVKAEVD